MWNFILVLPILLFWLFLTFIIPSIELRNVLTQIVADNIVLILGQSQHDKNEVQIGSQKIVQKLGLFESSVNFRNNIVDLVWSDPSWKDLRLTNIFDLAGASSVVTTMKPVVILLDDFRSSTEEIDCDGSGTQNRWEVVVAYLDQFLNILDQPIKLLYANLNAISELDIISGGNPNFLEVLLKLCSLDAVNMHSILGDLKNSVGNLSSRLSLFMTWLANQDYQTESGLTLLWLSASRPEQLINQINLEALYKLDGILGTNKNSLKIDLVIINNSEFTLSEQVQARFWLASNQQMLQNISPHIIFLSDRDALVKDLPVIMSRMSTNIVIRK